MTGERDVWLETGLDYYRRATIDPIKFRFLRATESDPRLEEAFRFSEN